MLPISYLQKHKADILQTYQHLHQLAEPSWKEAKTADYLSTRLAEAGLSVKRFPDHYGFIAEIPGQQKEVIAIRADMDALLQEVDGTMMPNHSCGHDAHSTMVLYTALAFAATKKQYPNTLRFLFQPAEEVGAGALQMIKDHALDDVKMLFGIHLRPWMEVANGKASPVILHRSSASIRGHIKGRQAHAARAKDGINPIYAAALLINQLKSITLDDNLYSVVMTHLESGNPNSTNIIPESATFTLDVRANSNETMENVQAHLTACIKAVEAQTNCHIQSKQIDYVPAAIKNDSAINLAANSIIEILGNENLVPVCPSPGGEDFHFYSQFKPEMISTMIGLGCDLKPGLHHPHMSFDQESLLNGAMILTNLLYTTQQIS